MYKINKNEFKCIKKRALYWEEVLLRQVVYYNMLKRKWVTDQKKENKKKNLSILSKCSYQ